MVCPYKAVTGLITAIMSILFVSSTFANPDAGNSSRKNFNDEATEAKAKQKSAPGTVLRIDNNGSDVTAELRVISWLSLSEMIDTKLISDARYPRTEDCVHTRQLNLCVADSFDTCPQHT